MEVLFSSNISSECKGKLLNKKNWADRRKTWPGYVKVRMNDLNGNFMLDAWL
jgi:hypothetical protein